MRYPRPKPCPACGETNLYRVYCFGGLRRHSIECRCTFSGEPAITKLGAVIKWNRRKQGEKVDLTRP